jgi:hypothetical protein
MCKSIKFICNAVKWFDKVNGNTYHSVKVIRCKDNKTICGKFQYGYGEHYRHTALIEMIKTKWLPKKYNQDNYYLFERENKYPIYWNVTEGLKRDCINNGKE